MDDDREVMDGGDQELEGDNEAMDDTDKPLGDDGNTSSDFGEASDVCSRQRVTTLPGRPDL